MENVVLQPTPGQTVVATNDGYGHRNQQEHRRDDSGFDKAILQQVLAGNAAAALASGTSDGVTRDSRLDVISNIKDSAAAAALASSVTDGITRDSRYDVVNNIKDAASAAALASAKTDANVAAASGHTNEKIASSSSHIVDKLDRGFERGASDACRIEREILSLGTSLVSGFKDSNSLQYQIAGQGLLEAAKNAAALQVQATANANAASVQSTNVFNLLNVQADKNRYEMQLQAQTFQSSTALTMQQLASQAALTAQQIAADAAAKAAECCCELKEAIHKEGETTRQLMLTDRVQALRDRNIELVGAYNVLSSRTVPVTSPIVGSP